LEYRLLTGNDLKWVRAKFELEFDRNRRPIAATGIVQDITTRRAREEEAVNFRRQLAHVSRVYTVGELAQNLAHEINQPLAAIMANAEASQQMLKAEKPDLAEVFAALEDILSDNRRAMAVIRRIRTLVKDTPQAYERLDINNVASEAARVMMAEATPKGVAIQMELEPQLTPVCGDQVQLQQVVLNLLLNAMDAVSQNHSRPKRILIQTYKERADGISLCVSDTGPGIAPEVMKRLFEPFFTTKPQGLGLGLSISRSILEAHGGHMGIASDIDHGARICCFLPAIAAAESC
jgi:C4-dicarboxylate-specific signal transduction histidine kinase